MTKLQSAIIALIATIGVIHSEISNPGEPLPVSVEGVEEEYLGHRPWENGPTGTTWVSLNGMGITSLNSMFALNIPNLRWLVMDNNRIESIPSKAFENLPELTYISLARNQIQKFESDAFSSLDKLKVIDLEENPISTNLDGSVFGQLPALQSLYLRKCRLSSSNFSGYSTSLSHLHLSGNELQTFYDENESGLTNLHLDSNHLSYVSLANFESLMHLDLRNNWLDKIKSQSQVSPASYLATLRGMWWGSYHATEHSALYLDHAPALQYLIASSNRITQIARDSFSGTESLIHLDLTKNQIGEVSAGTFNNLLKLEDILLDSNKITKISHLAFVNLPNLKTISLRSNQINDIDEEAFAKLNSSSNDISLHLDNNEIHTLRSGSFMGITGLKHIGLSGNKIKTILSQAFVNLPNLETLVIFDQLRDETQKDSVSNSELQSFDSGKNLIESFAFSDLPNLTMIMINGNEFTDIEAQAFDALPKLTLLDLSNNSIEYISPEAFSDLPEIEDLHLTNNFLSIIEPGTYPKSLKRLYLSKNHKCPDFSCWHIEELDHLEELHISEAVDRFEIEDLAGLPKNLTLVI